MNGQSYVTIGKVAATGSGAGNYSFVDNNTVSGNNYYRLKMVDIDGAFKYSHVIIVKFADKGGGVKIAPVPATSFVIFYRERPRIDRSACAGIQCCRQPGNRYCANWFHKN